MGTENSEYADNLVVCQNSLGVELRGAPLRVTRFAVVFEIYNPNCVLRLSEVLSDFQMVVLGRTVYAGRAVVGNLVNAGLTIVCEAVLEEACWRDVDLTAVRKGNGALRQQFAGFITEWQKLYRVSADYKLI